jgi:hypothetical protein
LGTFAPRRGIEERDGTLTEKGSVC